MPENDPENLESAAATAAKTQNLARIRDNQRRSRARRKEYLQELEEKYRQCEQLGVEASAEIQAAARRVLDENKRLRELLWKHGITDPQSEQPAGLESPQCPNPAAALESVLGAKRPCGSGDSGRPTSEASSRKQSSSSNTTPAHRSEARHPSADMESLALQSQVPTMVYQHTDIGVSNAMPAAPAAVDSVGLPSDPSSQQYQLLAAGIDPSAQPFSQQQPYTDDSMQYSNDFYWNNAQYTGQGYAELTIESDSIPPDSSSCQAAASVIRSMEPNAGYELEQELGCQPGQECNIPNADIFKIMDRYHGAPGL